jgi:hypothetical protein
MLCRLLNCSLSIIPLLYMPLKAGPQLALSYTKEESAGA